MVAFMQGRIGQIVSVNINTIVKKKHTLKSEITLLFSKICNIKFWIENDCSPAPLETFTKIHPFCWGHPSLRFQTIKRQPVPKIFRWSMVLNLHQTFIDLVFNVFKFWRVDSINCKLKLAFILVIKKWMKGNTWKAI